jgi:hypothetical protein
MDEGVRNVGFEALRTIWSRVYVLGGGGQDSKAQSGQENQGIARIVPVDPFG